MITRLMMAAATVTLGCPTDPPTTDTTPTVPDCLPRELIVVPATDPTPCDLDGSQMLAERYVGSDGIEEPEHFGRCAVSGGQLVWTAIFDEAGEFVCFDVDY